MNSCFCPNMWLLALLLGLCHNRSAPANEHRDRELVVQCGHSNVQEVSNLLAQGADPKAGNEVEVPAIHRAALGGNAEVLRLLVDNGDEPNVKLKGPFGDNPLARAAFRGDRAAVQALLQAGAKPDSEALVAAVWSRKVEMVNMLLDAGARPTLEALAAAATFGNTEMVLLFLKTGAPPDEGLVWAAARGRLELVRLLLEKGAQVNHQGKGGSTALHRAANEAKADVVRLLLQHGADPNITNAKNETPLHRAISGQGNRENIEVIKLLVQSRAKLNIPNHEGVTPVRLAAIRGAREAYDFLLAVAGGTEPVPAGEPGDQPTKELISKLTSKDPEMRMAAKRELVLHGKAIMPDVLQSIEAGVGIEHFYELFQAMGAQAQDALPLLEAQFTAGKEHLFAATLTIEQMKPGGLAELRPDAKQKLAKELYEAATDPGADVMAGFYADMLLLLGREAIPTILQGLRHEEPRVRELMAGHLKGLPFADVTLQAELIKLLREDPRPRVRARAASALTNPRFRSKEAKEALLEAWHDPPRPRYPTHYTESYGIERKERHENYLWSAEVGDFNASVPRAIAAYGPEIIDDLLPSVLAADDAESQRLAIPWNYLGVNAVPRFQSLLHHPDGHIRKIAAERLARLEKATPPPGSSTK